MKLRRKMRDMRRQLLMEQAEVAALLGVASCTLSRWETGIADPPYRRLVQLSELYGAPIEELMSTGM